MLRKIEFSKSALFAYFKLFFRSQFWQNKFNLALVLTALSFNIIIWVLIALFIKPSEFPIPLHYNIYFGIDLTGPYRTLYNLPVIGLFAVLINLNLAFWFYLKDRVISYIFLFTSLVVQIFVLVGTVAVIFINRL